MKISVIVPSYNQGAYIGRTIESVLNQHDPNIELIVMDGGSSDSTLSVLESYRDRIDVLVSEKDGGQSDALQKGLERATGEFVGWQNSDDVYLPGSFQLFRERFQRDKAHGPIADVYFGNLCVIDRDDRLLYRKIYGPFRADYLQYAGWNITNQSSLFSRAKLNAIGGFDASLQYAMDFDLYMRLANGGARFSWINRYLAGFRLHPQAKGSTLQNTRDKEYKLLRSRYLPNYRPDLIWTQQFRARRFKERALRLLGLGIRGDILGAIAGKWGMRGSILAYGDSRSASKA